MNDSIEFDSEDYYQETKSNNTAPDSDEDDKLLPKEIELVDFTMKQIPNAHQKPKKVIQVKP